MERRGEGEALVDEDPKRPPVSGGAVAGGRGHLGGKKGGGTAEGRQVVALDEIGEAKIGDDAGGSQVTETTGYAWKMGRDNMSTTAVRTAK